MSDDSLMTGHCLVKLQYHDYYYGNRYLEPQISLRGSGDQIITPVFIDSRMVHSLLLINITFPLPLYTPQVQYIHVGNDEEIAMKLNQTEEQSPNPAW